MQGSLFYGFVVLLFYFFRLELPKLLFCVVSLLPPFPSLSPASRCLSGFSAAQLFPSICVVRRKPPQSYTNMRREARESPSVSCVVVLFEEI
jgi:hypothetical protein